MAKRFHDTEIWEQDWFLDAPSEYKLLWLWIKDKCDHAGLWKPNKKMFEMMNNVKVDLDKALSFFNKDKERILVTKNGNWFLIDFFVFQYGVSFNNNNRLPATIQKVYYQEDIELTTIRGLKEVNLSSNDSQEEDTKGVKDKDKEIIEKRSAEKVFDDFRKIYPGTKTGNKMEFENFVKKHKDWKDVLPKLNSIIQSQKEIKRKKSVAGGFVPHWKNLKTWINQRCWEEEIPLTDNISADDRVNPNGNGYAIDPQSYIFGTPPQGKFVGKITQDQ